MARRTLDPFVTCHAAFMALDRIVNDESAETIFSGVFDRWREQSEELLRTIPTTHGGCYVGLERVALEFRAREDAADDWPGRREALATVVWSYDRLMAKKGAKAILGPLEGVLAELCELDGEDHPDAVLLASVIQGIRSLN